MLNKIVIIQKHLEKQILKKYFFIEGKIDINSKYFIDKMEQGFLEKANQTGKTNIEGCMTSFNFFNNDDEFKKIITKLVQYIDLKIPLASYYLQNSWGFCTQTNEKTKFHNHDSQMFSGVLYLNDHDLNLQFKEIDQMVKPEKGKFVLFSSFLEHGTNKSSTIEKRYGISFDFCWRIFR